MGAKSSFSNATSKSYALAIFEISKESSTLDKIEYEMKNISKLLDESSEFKKFIMSPLVTKEDKQNVLFKIAEQNNFSLITKNFLGFVAKKNRLFFLDKIIGSFLNLISNNKGELKAKLISSKKLSKEEQNKIQSELSKDFKSYLNIDYTHDPDLIAGLIIQVGSVMVDTSIKTKLKKLEQSMVEV